MRQERALPPSAKSCLEIAPCDQIESRPVRRPIRKGSTFPLLTRQLSSAICDARCRPGIPFPPRTCKGQDLVAMLGTNNSGCRAFSDCCPTGKANAALPARANQKAMVREGIRQAFLPRLAADRGAKQSRPPTGRIKE